jgi:hypothetical protein
MCETSPRRQPFFLVCDPPPLFRPPAWLFVGLFTGMRQASRPTSRRDSARHGSMTLSAALTTAAACWQSRVKFKVSNKRKAKEIDKSRKRGKVVGIITRWTHPWRRYCWQTTLSWRFIYSDHYSTGISRKNLADGHIATNFINDPVSLCFIWLSYQQAKLFLWRSFMTATWHARCWNRLHS